MKSLRQAWLILGVLLMVAQTCGADVTEIGKLKAGRETLSVSLSDGSLRLSFRKAKLSSELSLAEWDKFHALLKKARRQASRLKPDEADYTGRVGQMHVGVTYDESGRYRGQRILIYMVLEDRRRSGVDLEERKWDALEQLMDKTNNALNR